MASSPFLRRRRRNGRTSPASCEQISSTSSPCSWASSRRRSAFCRRASPSTWLNTWKARSPAGQCAGVCTSTVVEVGVAAVQDPAVCAPDRDAGVPERVPGQRDQQDLGVAARQDPNAVESEPLVAAGVMPAPARPVRPVRRYVAGALAPSRGASRHRARVPSRCTSASGKSGRPPGVIEVEMGGHDVAHVRRLEARARGSGRSPSRRRRRAGAPRS